MSSIDSVVLEIQQAMFREAMDSGGTRCVHCYQAMGYFLEGIDALEKDFLRLGLHPWAQISDEKEVFHRFYGNDTCDVEISGVQRGSVKGKFAVRAHGVVPVGAKEGDFFSLVDVIKEKTTFSEDMDVDPKRLGKIFALTPTKTGLDIDIVGNAGVDFVPHNYSTAVVEGYEKVRENLVSDSPDGRLVILSGEPGTGKTHLIRSLASNPSIALILVDPKDIIHMTSPEIFKACTNFTKSYPKMKPVFVLEDCDSLLLARMGDNMNSISALLNMTDGIRGSILDLRVLATTNGKKLDMDSAILRPGRLIAHLELKPLTLKEANLCLSKLIPDLKEADHFTSQKVISKGRGFSMPENVKDDTVGVISLAEVYRKARDLGWKPPPPPPPSSSLQAAQKKPRPFNELRKS